MSYQNLKAEMTRLHLTQDQIAEFLGMSRNNFNLKVNERVPFTVDEIKAIRDRFFPENNLDYLFASDGCKPSKEVRAIARVDAVADAMMDGCEDDPKTVEIARELRETAACVDPDRVLKILG